MGRKKNLVSLALMAATAIGITVCAVIWNAAVWRILPLYNSLVIAHLNSRVDRRAFLLGGLNSILYAVVHFSYGLYALAGYSLLVSMPLQLVTFIRWNKRPYENSTVFRRLTWKGRVGLSAGFVIAWTALYALLSQFDASYLLLDNTVTLIGVLVSVLAMFPYIEYIWLNILSVFISIILYIVMLRESPEQTTYLVYNIYAFICVVMAAHRSQKLYAAQQTSAK